MQSHPVIQRLVEIRAYLVRGCCGVLLFDGAGQSVGRLSAAG